MWDTSVKAGIMARINLLKLNADKNGSFCNITTFTPFSVKSHVWQHEITVT